MSDGVLWVTSEVPDREAGGGNQRQAYLLHGLAELAPVDLVVAGRVTDPLVRNAARRVVEVEVAPIPPSPRRIVRRGNAAVNSWVLRRPLDVADHRRVRAALLREVRAAGPAAAVVVHHQALAPMLAELPATAGRRVLHLFHAAGDRAEQLAQFAPQALQRALLRRDGRNARAVERDAIDDADALVVTTKQDLARLGRPATPTIVVPQGVDLDRFAPSPLPPAPRLLFSGSLNYDPNVDGLLWFVDEVFPLVQTRVPAVALDVVGHRPVAVVAALAGRAGITVHADVPAMAPWLTAARVSVAPLRVGTGVRVKVLEALAAGRPVVGTSVALEGIDVGPEEAAVADDPASFADAVVALLLDDELADRRAAAGRAKVASSASWSASARVLHEALVGDLASVAGRC